MINQGKKPQSIFPDYIREQPIIGKDGKLTHEWDVQLGALFQAAQVNFSNEGILFPSLTIDEINTIQNIYVPYIGKPLPQNDPTNMTQKFIPDISGKTVFDSTNRVSKQFIITYDGATPPNIVTAQWRTFMFV
jgi:hypothetical protein